MRKFIIAFFMLMSFTLASHAETYWYKATSFALAEIRNNYYNWSDWERSNVSISIDLTNDVITIYSQVKQTYYVVSTEESGSDNSGGRFVRFYVVDSSRRRGNVRLRIESNGNSQMYIDFNDYAWCYNVVRTR